MAKESDISLLNEVLEPFRRAINTDPPKDKLSSKFNISNTSQTIKEDITNLLSLGKRKCSSLENATPNKRFQNSSNITTVPMSPWESKKLRCDLVAAKAQIAQLEGHIDRQHTLRKEMQIVFEEEKEFLIQQQKTDKSTISSMENHIEYIRKREKDLKEQLDETLKTIGNNKQKWDEEKINMQNEIANLKNNLLEDNSSSKGQLSEMKKDMDELLQALEGAQAEADMLKKKLADQLSNASQCTELKTQLEKKTFELSQVTVKLKKLETEQESHKQWQQEAKIAHKRLMEVVELKKEVTRLRATERNLRDAVSNKLLLEEQVHSLTSRLDALQPVQQELQEARLKVSELESAVEMWISVGRTHGANDPSSLSAAIETSLQKQFTAVTECAQARSQLARLTDEMANMKCEYAKSNAKLIDLQSVKSNQDNLLHRLRKRLSLVTKERDCYREQLDGYEKELTVTMCGESGTGSAALLSARVEQLEKALQSYRDLLSQHDLENNSKIVESLRSEVTKWREEAETLRRDTHKLRTQRDNLQTQLKRLEEPYSKMLHLTDNPAALAQKQVQADLESAQEEIKKLKAALRDGSSACPDDMVALKQQLDNSKIKLQRMKEEFTSSAQEYRDVCYMLLGYKVDRTGHKNYRISNMYAESQDEYLTFTVSDEGIEMVHTEYSTSLEELVDLHLHQHQSIPVFLSALTMELFTRTTMQH